jgi:hypothetical protein
MAEKECFGFFSGSALCKSCPAQVECKVVLFHIGFDIMRSVVSETLYNFPETQTFLDSDRIPVIVDQIEGKDQKAAPYAKSAPSSQEQELNTLLDYLKKN